LKFNLSLLSLSLILTTGFVEAKEEIKKLDFCNKENLSIKQEIVCDQEHIHQSMIDNPLAFVIFYVFSVLFIAFIFQLSQKKPKKKDDIRK
tara:strand:- start:8517 stop:8789 length:273 start_codon:yes stop_codon:yes gene_type:complete